MKGVCPGMTLITWSYLRSAFLALAQSFLFIILLHPWLKLASNHWKFPLSWGLVWVLMTLLVSIVMVQKATSKGKNGLKFLAGGIVGPVFLAALFRLPFFIFIPLLFLCFLVSLRFNNYPKRARFALDWALGSLFLIIAAGLEGALGIEVGVSAVLLFFALGTASLIIWNAVALEGEGLQPDYGGLARSIFLFILVVGGISLALGLLLSPVFWQAVVDLVQRFYLLIVDGLLLFVVRPFVWLLTPLFRWVENLELQEFSLELPANEIMGEETLTRPSSPLSPETMDKFTWISWVVVVCLALLITWIVLRRILRRPRQEGGGFVQETRESVFSGAEVLDDLKSVFRGLLKTLTQVGPGKWYKGNEPMLRIRTLYARFALWAGRSVSMGLDATPREYAGELIDAAAGLDEGALLALTELYNEARYGESADMEAVNRAEKALHNLR